MTFRKFAVELKYHYRLWLIDNKVRSTAECLASFSNMVLNLKIISTLIQLDLYIDYKIVAYCILNMYCIYYNLIYL